MPTLYDIYKNQGQALPNTVDARFADPKFAQAAQQAGITQDQYKINAGNAGYNTQIASLYGKTPTTTATAVTAPPVANPSSPVANPLPIAPVDSNMNDVYSNYDNYLTNPTGYLQSKGVSEANSRAQALAAMQAQIDSTNNYYADQLRQAQVRGQGNIGTTGAVQARRGLLGSDFGNAQTDTVIKDNQNIYDSINNEKKLKVQELMSKAETSGIQRFQDERTAIEGGLKSRIDFLKSSDERKKTKTDEAAMALLASGHTTKDMTPEQQVAYAKGYGTSLDSINSSLDLMTYKKKQEDIKRQNEIADALAKKGIDNVTSGSQGYAYNPKTNKYELIANNPKVVAPIRVRTGGDVSQALKDGISKGIYDPNKINSRTLSIYNDLANSSINASGAHADISAKTKAYQDAVTYSALANRTTSVLDKNMPLVIALADKVNVTNTPGLDRAIAGVQSYTGNNPDIIKYVNSIKTVRAEYANMLAKGNQVTDNIRADAADAIPTGLSSAGYQALLDQLHLETHNIISAANESADIVKPGQGQLGIKQPEKTTSNIEQLRKQYNY